MFVVPFIHRITTENGINIHSISILTIGGKNLWEEDKSLDIDVDILNANDIWRIGEITTVDKTVKLCEVDVNKTKISDFYKWSELPFKDDETFCWRNFVYLLGSKGEVWLSLPHNERLGHTSLNKLLTSIVNKKTKEV